jgi:hypothetical protein
MKVEELLKDILKNPPELVLDFTLRVDHAIGFSEFLWALSSSKAIRRIDYHGIFNLDLSNIQKVQLIESFGQIEYLEELCFSQGVNISTKALASTIRKSRSLRILNIGMGSRVIRDDGTFISSSEPATSTVMTTFARALQYHPSLESFVWILRQSFDPVIGQALATCPKLRHVSLTEFGNSSVNDGIVSLKESSSIRSLEIRTSYSWESIVELLDERYRQTGIHLTTFGLTLFPSRSDQHLTLESVATLANYIEANRSLEKISIGGKGWFTNEMWILLADAVKRNRGNLRFVELNSLKSKLLRHNVLPSNQCYLLNETTYSAFCNALCENHNIVLQIDINLLPEIISPQLLAIRSNAQIMSKLNFLGRGKLQNDDATKLDWIRVFHQINKGFCTDEARNKDAIDGVSMSLSCIYTLLRMSPLSIINPY